MILQKDQYKQLNIDLLECIDHMKDGNRSVQDRFANILTGPISDSIRKFHTNEDDILSTTGAIIVKLISEVHKFDSDRDPIWYIKRAAVNFCIDEFRKDRARKKREQVYSQRDSNLSKQMNKSDLNAERILDEVYGPYREIIQLKFIENKTIPEIVEITGLPRKTVSFWVQAAQVKCREYLYDNHS